MMERFYKVASIVFGLLFTTSVANAQCPSITCPSNITVNKDPNLCGAIVSYTTPLGVDPCMTIPQSQTFSYTGTRGAAVEVISLSPNPVTGVGTIAVSAGEASNAEVKILDAVGRELYNGRHALNQGMNSISLDMNNLPQGNYTLHVVTDAGNAAPIRFTKL